MIEAMTVAVHSRRAGRRQRGLDGRAAKRHRVAGVAGTVLGGLVRRLLESLCLAVIVGALASSPLRAAVVVSSKLSSESAMIGEMIIMTLRAHGIAVVDRTRLGATPLVRKALLAGEIDLYVEYTGNGAFFFNAQGDPAWRDLDRGYALGARLDYDLNRIVWLAPARADNSWALAVRSDVARANRLGTMSDFARWVGAGGHVVLACSAEFANAGTLRSLERTYGFHLRPQQKIVLAGGETTAMIAAAAAGTDDVDVAMVYGTDGGILAANLVVLRDDRHDQPVYAPVPLVRAEVLARHPQIATLIAPLMASFDAATLRGLNARVQIDGESTSTVAADYLASRGLLH